MTEKKTISHESTLEKSQVNLKDKQIIDKYPNRQH